MKVFSYDNVVHSANQLQRLAVARSLGLEPETLVRAFRIMQTSRLLDDREINP